MSTDPAKAKKRLADLAIMRTLIHSKDFAVERELMATKWFEYRFMSPLAATELFAAKYTEGLQSYVRANFDVELSAKVRGVPAGLPSKRERWFTQVWRARQRADTMCVPYELVIEFGFHFASRRKRKWTPLPHQLFASEANSEAWHGLFPSFVEDQMPIYLARLDDPRYRSEHDHGLSPQLQFREFMRDELKASTRSWPNVIAAMWFERRYLSLEDCLNVVPIDSRREVREGLRLECLDGFREPAPQVELADEDFDLGCFGVSEAIDMTNDDCGVCPLKERCVETAEAVAETVTTRTGSATPIRDGDRERIRKNTANCRARKAAKLDAPVPALFPEASL